MLSRHTLTLVINHQFFSPGFNSADASSYGIPLPRCSLSYGFSPGVQPCLSYIPATYFSCSNDHSLHCLPYLSCTLRAFSFNLFIQAPRKACIQNQHPYPHRMAFGPVHKRCHMRTDMALTPLHQLRIN